MMRRIYVILLTAYVQQICVNLHNKHVFVLLHTAFPANPEGNCVADEKIFVLQN